MKNRNALAVCALIGICFLLTGSEYISWWLYGLPRFFGDTAVDLLSEGAGYLFQVAGLLLFAFFVKKKAERHWIRRSLPVCFCWMQLLHH